MDKLKLEYVLKKHEVTKQKLIEVQDWGNSTYYRKVSGESDWSVEEINRMMTLGVTLTEVIDIFFK